MKGYVSIEREGSEQGETQGDLFVFSKKIFGRVLHVVHGAMKMAFYLN